MLISTGVQFGNAIKTTPRFPLPDVAQEIIRAGRYAGPLVPGAADHAAKLTMRPKIGGGLFGGVTGLLNSVNLSSNIDLEAIAVLGISAATGIPPTTIQTGIDALQGDATIQDFIF